MLDESEIETDWSRAKRARVQGRFLKGPIPFTRLCPAAKLPGRALNVFVAICHQTDLTQKEWVTLPKGLLCDLGVSRDAKSRALASRRVYDCRTRGSLGFRSRASQGLA